MSMAGPPAQTLTAAVKALRSGEVSSEQLTQRCLDRIASHGTALNAFLHVDAPAALAQARAADQRRAGGTAKGPLDGIPVAHKDMLCTAGMPTTAASRILEGYVPQHDATVVQQWRNAGTVLLGKLNLDEFAMGSSSENSAYGTVTNPWDRRCVAGGSSGGSAAAVAAGLCLGATGTDTGGSIRLPAALCGISGLKPTYGRVSRFGVVAYASSLDQVGPMARSVEDLAWLMGITAGTDPRDSTSLVQDPVDWNAALTGDVSGVRIGVPRQLARTPGVDPQVASAVDKALKELESRGAVLKDVDLPSTAYALDAYYIIAPAEASANLARYDGARFGPRRGTPEEGLRGMYQRTRGELFGPEVRRRILLGTFVLSVGYHDAFYTQAQKVRTLVQQDYARAFADVDMVATPTSPGPAFRCGERVKDPMAMYLTDIFTLPCNLAGLPGLSLPCGFVSGERPLPVGLQLVGPAMADEQLLRVGDAYQRHTDWHLQAPTDGGAA